MKGKARRLLSWVCVLALCMSLLPVTALAVTDGETTGTETTKVFAEENGVTVNKWVSTDGDGNYRLNMEAYASNEVTSTTTTKPLDIVLVLDVSGSMDERLGEGSFQYTPASRNEWTYNNVASREYYYNDGESYQRVYARADYEGWRPFGEYTNFRLTDENDQLIPTSKTGDSADNVLYTGTLYTRTWSEGDTKLEAMKKAVNAFIDQVALSSDQHRISVVKFASEEAWPGYYNDTKIVCGLTNTNKSGVTTLKGYVNDLWAGGATRADMGLELAEDILDRNTVEGRDSKEVVVLFTDGEPTSGSSFEDNVAASAVNTAKGIKDDGVTIYTVGMFGSTSNEDVTDYMNGVSSNHPEATAVEYYQGQPYDSWQNLYLGTRASSDYYFTADSASDLENIFEGIAEDVTTSTLAVCPDETAILSDTLSEYFDFPADMQTSSNGSDVTVSYVKAKSVNDGTITWEESASELPDGSDIEVEVTDGTITITGFDYYENAVTKHVVNGETTYSGGKLVVSFPIELDEAACVADTSITNGQYPTNSIEKDSQAGLAYKAKKDDKANIASTLLDKSPTVYYDTTSYDANGTDVTVQVYVDGKPVMDPDTYVSLSRNSGNTSYTYWKATLDSDSGIITCDFDYYTGEGYDCVDIDVTLTNQAYVLQGIQSFQSYGSSGTKNVTPGADEWTIDNVTAVGNKNDPDVKIYLRTKYNVKYYVDDTESKDIVDNTNYISHEDVTETSNDNLQGKDNSWMYWHDESLKTNIVLANLPSNTDETTYDGWYLGGLTGDKLESGPAVSEDSDTAAGDQNDNIIRLYAKSSAAEYTVTYKVTGEEPITSSAVPTNEQHAIGTEVTVAGELTTTEDSHNGVPGTWTFSGWTTNDVTVDGGVFTMPAKDVEFTGHWTFTEANKVNVIYTVTSMENPTAESISGMPTNTEVYVGSDVTAGSTPTTTSTTNGEVQGTWTFSGWSTEDSLTNVQEDVNFTGYWTFTPNTHTITVNVTNGTAEADGLSEGTITVNDNGSVTITFTGNEGYALDTVTVDDRPAVLTTNEDGNTTYTFSNVKGNHEISVVYEEDKIGGENPENPGDGTPDKHQATVTYNVVNGTFGENGPTTKSYVVTTDVYQTIGENAGTWTPLNKHVGESECPIPENMTPDSSHVEPGAWGKPEPSNTVLLEGNQTYTYTYTFGTEVEKSLLVTKELTLVGGKEYNKSGIVDEGSELTYTITVTNTGNVALTDIVVTDTLTINGVEDEVTLGYNGEDSNVTINKDGTATITSLGVGKDVTLTATYTVPEGTAGQKISNTAVATSDDITNDPEDSVEVTVANPDVEITKELTSASRPGDGDFKYNAATYRAQVGDELHYTITVKNTGNTHIKVDVTDSLWGNGVNTVYIGGDTTGTPVDNGNPVTIAMLPEKGSQTITYTYTVQASDIGKQNISNTAIASTGTEEDDPKDEDTVTVPMDDYTVTITPANITIYTGGDGYSGVTDGDGNVIPGTETSGLPEPGYHIELPDAVVNWLAEQGIIASGSNADDVAANLSEYLTFTYDYNNQTRDWSMGYAGIYSTNETTGEPTRYVYTLNPAKVEDKEIPVRLLYKNGETVVSTDDILMSETLVSDQFSMTINPGELTQSQIRAKLTVEGQSISCNIDIQPGTLTVRSTTDKDTTTEIVNEQGDVTSNTITAVDGGEVQYYVNNSEVTVDADRVQLLVDEVSNGEEFNAAMGADAITRAGVNSENAAYDLAYMDLVDTQNGNTVVTMDEGDSLTIYWPVPENAAADSEFHVVHYTGMDRENTVDADKLSAQAADVKTGEDAVEKVTIGDQEYVKFTTDSFSPFALVYEKAPDPVAKLEVTKTLTKVNDQPYNNGSVSVNDTLTYTITVKNGEVALKDVTITDTFTGKGDLNFRLPDGATVSENQDGTYTITLGDLTAGQEVTITATYKVLRADASSNLVNTAKVTGTNPGDPGNPVTDEVQTPETPVNPYRPPIRPPEDPDKPELNTEDHYAYIVGYEDGSVQPEGDITRAEVATIFFRLLTDESRNEYWSQTNPYSDVSADDWFNNAVSTLTNAGVLDGYEDGTFKPNGNITRAEFATITARFFEATYDGENLFPDIEGHWAQDYINEAANAGIVNGYEDGTFRPQQYITRAEAVTMVNRTIERHPDADHLLDNMITWPDNPETAWYYEQIQEATNSHEYTMNTDDEQNPYEIWTKLLPNRDWSELEKEWSDANDGAGSGEVV